MFAGEVITVYPANDDAALYLFHLIVQKYGWGWMDKYMATKPNFIQGHLPVARSVASGEMSPLSIPRRRVWPLKREGKLEIVWSPSRRDAGIHAHRRHLQDAPHPNAASSSSPGTSPRSNEPGRLVLVAHRRTPPPGFKPLTSYKIANDYREFMTDDKLVADLRKRFEGTPARRSTRAG